MGFILNKEEQDLPVSEAKQLAFPARQQTTTKQLIQRLHLYRQG